MVAYIKVCLTALIVAYSLKAFMEWNLLWCNFGDWTAHDRLGVIIVMIIIIAGCSFTLINDSINKQINDAYNNIWKKLITCIWRLYSALGR